MASIYELTGAYKALEVAIMLNPDDEELKAELEKITDDIKTKADNYAKLIRNIEADVKALDDEEKRIRERKQMFKRTIERLKDNLMFSMKETGETKFKTELFSFSVANNGGKLPLKLNVGIDELPDELVSIEKKANSDAIRAYIDETGDLSYAEYEERGQHLSIR